MLVAAETDALPGGKVGGVADVIRDLPLALARRGWQPTVLTPAYGLFNQLPGATRQPDIAVNFAGDCHMTSVWQIVGPNPQVRHLAIEHPLLSPHGAGQIYSDDGAQRPFATDAGKFAFFCAATAALLADGDSELLPDIIHLHDWHTAFYFLLRDYMPAFAQLKNIRSVFTIHNTAMQGIRPLAGDQSSLEAWFPGHDFPLQQVVDPRYPDCINPLAVAIRLADAVNTVSPSYAQEILRPSDAEHGFSGGEGLEQDLRAADAQGRLTGILNGCEYPLKKSRRPGWARLIGALQSQVSAWQTASTAPMHRASAERLKKLPRRRPASVLTSVGRLTEQKVALFLQEVSAGRCALELILDQLGKNGVLILLGSGDKELERRIGEIAVGHKNLLFICGYSATLAELLYQAGDLFLMPSSFEPCGISQMLAMRAGQPCVVHGVGGLQDTVADGTTGFVFRGASSAQQAAQFVVTVNEALHMKSAEPEAWAAMRANAAAARFSWDAAAEAYENELYETAGN